MQQPMSPNRLLLILICFSATVIVNADEESKSASDVKPKVTSISGVFEAINTHELSAGTDQIKSLKIMKIVPHGTAVGKGQNLVWFETEEVDKRIKEAGEKLRLSELTFKDEQFAHEQFVETQKLDRAAADRAYQVAKQKYDNFVQVDRERQIESAHFNLKNAEASLENVMEELTQLEQMYKEDDLTEESEEIVLKRAKQAVDNAQFRLKGTEVSTQRELEQSIPRSVVDQKDALARAQLTHAKAIRDINIARQRRDIELRQKGDKFKEEQDDFKELQEQRKQLVIQSPQAGIAFHGKITRGKISEKPSTLAEGVSVTNDQVLVTVAEPNRLQIRADLQEKDLQRVTVARKEKSKSPLTRTAKSPRRSSQFRWCPTRGLNLIVSFR